MENAAILYGKRVIKLGREIKHWGTWEGVKNVIDAFKKTMPLITDLRNPAIRPRHWQAVMARAYTRPLFSQS